MDFDLLDSLDDLGYSLKDDCKIKDILKIGPKSIEFSQLVEWFSKELQTLLEIDSCVNAIIDPDDSSAFLLEISSFLKELNCPYKALVTGPISQRLLNEESRLTLLDYLCTELQAARIIYHRNKKTKALEIEMNDSAIASSLNSVQNVLDIKMSENVDPISVFSEIEKKVKEHISNYPDVLSKPALEENLSEEQWEFLNDLHKDFLQDYLVRRELLLTRLDVTVQSFKWGERNKGKEGEILKAYVYKRAKLKKTPSVKLSDVISARESIFIIEKTSSDELVKNTKSSLKRFLIAAVPDRGGRPKEQQPYVEMPNWKKRRGGGGGGGRGDHRGGGSGRYKGKKNYRGPKGGDKGENFDAAGSY